MSMDLIDLEISLPSLVPHSISLSKMPVEGVGGCDALAHGVGILCVGIFL